MRAQPTADWIGVGIMMAIPPPHATWQRYEAKYIVDDRLAAQIRDLCGRSMALDPHSAARANRRYPIHSIYLDSPDRLMARHVVERRTERVKLRIRRYREMHDGHGELPSYFEIKRKCYGIVRKTRARLTACECDRFFRDPFDFRAAPDAEPPLAARLTEFLDLRARMAAEPVIAVFYTREAYENRDDGLRISFDRDLHYGLLDDAHGRTCELWWPVPIDGVILEIKFTNTYPFWIRNLIGRSELARRGVCKYLMCSQASRGVSLSASAKRCL